ncbi:MAG: TetR/AcrR family transcriptional regulator [Clostridia bacterium]
MPRTAEANRRLREDRAAQIRATAAAVFARNGYVGTRVEDIATEAGISKGLLYHYFGDKAALYTTLVARAAAGTIHVYEAAGDQADSALDRLAWLIDEVVAGLQEQPDLFMVVLQTLVSDAVPEAARVDAERLVRRTQALMTALIRRGQEEGTLASGDPADLALVFSASIQGLAVAHVMTRSIPAVRDTLLALFARGSNA